MTGIVRKMLDPQRWRRYAAQRRYNWQRARAENRLDGVLANMDRIKIADGEATVVADGMWANPNHFFRLRLFIEALAAEQPNIRLLGLLRTRKDTVARRALERLGFSEFVFVDEDPELRTAQFLAEGDRLLSQVQTHRDLLGLQLPDGLPAYTYYDTVLKLAAHPQPDLDNPLWRSTLAQTLRNNAIYRREFDARRVTHVVLSHPWKNEWATLVWMALGRGIPAYHLTGFCEAIRVRRFRSHADYATPVEHLLPAQFDGLPAAVQQHIARVGRRDLARRSSGTSTDINARHAFDPSIRIVDRGAARRALSGQNDRPVAVIYNHVWFDFPHTFAMSNFTDMRDWFDTTLARVRELDQVVWLLKPHPTENWYGGFKLAEAVGKLPPHVRVLPIQTDSETAMTAADAVVTVHGTVGLEAAARGLPVVLADRSYFSDWNVAHAARDRGDYLRLLGKIADLAPPDEAARARASACFALALAEPTAEIGALRMSCDAGGPELYRELTDLYVNGASERGREVSRIGEFLRQSEFDSFAAYHLVEAAKRSSAGHADERHWVTDVAS